MRQIAVFDFDGTLTKKDTFPDFISFVFGRRKMICGFVLFAIPLILMKFKLLDNSKMKQQVFDYFFKGMPYNDFKIKGIEFSEKINSYIRDDVYGIMKTHKNAGNGVYVISASIEEWVRPWCERNGIENVLGTKVEIDDSGSLTGRFLSSNCYGQEKVNRFLALEQDRQSYYLYAYGDSRGDKEMIEFADKGQYV